MAFKPISSNAVDIKKLKDQSFIGVFIGIDKIKTALGPQVIFQFRDKDDSVFGIYGFTHLNNQFISKDEETGKWDTETLKIPYGKLLRITYTGKKALKNKFGKSEIHTALVEVDDDAQPEEKKKEEEVPF